MPRGGSGSDSPPERIGQAEQLGASDLDRDTVPSEFRPRQSRRRTILMALITSDVLVSLVAVIAATFVRFGAVRTNIPLGSAGVHTDYVFVAAAIALVFPSVFALEHLYDIDALFWGSGEFSRVIRAVTLSVSGVIIASYLFHTDNVSRLWLGYVWLFAALLLVAGRWVFRMTLHAIRRRSQLLRPTLIVGCNLDARRMALSLETERTSGLKLIGCLTGDAGLAEVGEELIASVPVVGHVSELPEAVTRLGADAVVIVSSAFEQSEVSGIVSVLRRLPIDVHISSGLFDVLPARILVREVAGTPFMLVRSTSLATHKLHAKRTFDILFSTMVLVAGLPLWMLIATVIKLDSPGPVFYRQLRVGRAGSGFGMFKFRSMCCDAEARLESLKEHNESDGPLFKMRNDPRITRVGRFMRKYSLDEFPQFLNVLLGDMSVVGPRPPLPAEAESYDDRQLTRLDVHPGITGLWQVSGRSDLTFDEMVRLDLFYIENWSLRYDLTLVMRTIPSVIFGHGAY